MHMRVLFVHADRVAFEATTAVEPGVDAAEPDGAPSAGELTDCVAAFVGVESADATALDAVVADAADELRAAIDRLNADGAVLSPADHLVDDPADAERVRTVLRGLDAAIAPEIEVVRAPVGWHAALDLSAKGHPFARRSVRIDPADAREAPPTERRLLGADGELTHPEDLDAALDDARAVLDADPTGAFAGDRGDGLAVERLRESGLADSPDDDGGLRWLPRGAVVRDVLAAYAADLAAERDGAPIETAGVDGVRTGGDAPSVADPGVESTDRPAWRFDPGRETPELRAATRDPERAREAFRAGVEVASRASEALGLDVRPMVRATRAFYADNETWLAELAGAFDAPVPVEVSEKKRGSRSLAVDLLTIDADDRALAVAGVRLDRAAPDRDGPESDGPVRRVRCAPVGRLDRAVDALAASAARRDPPGIPTWLAPTQVRLVPVADRHLARCEAVATALDPGGVRVDIDDRTATVGDRLADAAADWVPYYAVVGDRERDADALDVTVGREATERELTVSQLREAVAAAVGDKPRSRLSTPRRVSRRPRFADRGGR